MDEVLARLLAVGHDVDAGRFLVLERGQHGITLALGERLGGSRHGAHSGSGVASHAGLGRLPAIVVRSIASLPSAHGGRAPANQRGGGAAHHTPQPPGVGPVERGRRPAAIPYRARIHPADGHRARASPAPTSRG